VAGLWVQALVHRLGLLLLLLLRGLQECQGST
jgi:hypothetical protein